MMTTVLAIIQAMRKRLNLSVPTSIYGSTDPDEMQMLELVISTCEELRQARVFSQQKRTYTFTTTASRSKYQLPADFYSPILATGWNQSEDIMLVGPVSDAQMNAQLYGTQASTINYSYRVFGFDENTATGGGQFELSPTPSETQTLSFDYITRHLFLPKHWAASTAYTTNTKVNVSGQIYNCTTSGTSGTTAPSTTGTGITDGTAVWSSTDTPYETIAVDTDLCIFDYDLVKLGLRAKWIEEKGGVYQDAKMEFEKKISQAVARYKGSYIGDSARMPIGPNYRVPYRNWSI
jgi:hypothetical protein